MNCPDCGAAAAEDANFCVICGRHLSTDCPSCGEANHADSHFCHTCGSSLTGGTATPLQPVGDTSCPRCNAVNAAATAFCYACGLPFDRSQRPQTPTAGRRVSGGAPAGFWIRLLAWVIDFLVLLAVRLALLALLPGISIEEYSNSVDDWIWFDNVMLLAGVAYYTVGVSVFSTTAGKRVLGLYVLRSDGSKISLLRAFGRYLAYIPSALILGVGFLMVAFRQDKRALHDLISDTAVVKG